MRLHDSNADQVFKGSKKMFANFLLICVNLQKYWNKVKSNDGLII